MDVQRKRGPRFREVAQTLAERQHGAVARRQLLAAGIPGGTIDKGLARRFLFPLFPGVYAVGRPRIGKEGLWMAGVLVGGEKALLAYRSAASAWGILDFRPLVVLLRPYGHGSRRAMINLNGNVRSIPLLSRRTRSLPESDRAQIQGIPVTSVPRTLLDICSNSPESVAKRAFLESDRLGLLVDAELEDCVNRCRGRPGGAVYQRLVCERIPQVKMTKSQLEARFLDLCRAGGVVLPEVNSVVGGFEGDCHWPSQGLVVELDGFAFHRGREKFEQDAWRTNELRMEGWTVLRFTWRMVTRNPEQVLNQLRQELASGQPIRRRSKR